MRTVIKNTTKYSSESITAMLDHIVSWVLENKPPGTLDKTKWDGVDKLIFSRRRYESADAAAWSSTCTFSMGKSKGSALEQLAACGEFCHVDFRQAAERLLGSLIAPLSSRDNYRRSSICRLAA
jgi:hypothetical protein